jgi:uncharacterized protein YecT (DUF1311 family)
MRALLAAALVAFSIAVLSPSGAMAQANDCSNASTQTDMNLCAAAAQKSANRELNKAYNALIARIADKSVVPQLRDAERAWLAYRDKECSFETSLTIGGTVHPMMVAQCLEAKTQARIKELQVLLDCQEGDMSCVPLAPP